MVSATVISAGALILLVCALSVLLIVAAPRRQGQPMTTDQLTGLLTVVAWRQPAADALARCGRRAGCAGLLMIDLDHLSRVNEHHGRPAGDAALRAVARILRAEAGHDLVARCGGEEFLVLTPAGAQETARLAERIRARTQQLSIHTRTAGHPTTVGNLSLSIGMAVYPCDGRTLDELILAADLLLFAAKDSGRNQVRATRPGFRSTAA